MSILIEDMEMPERCLECPLYDNYNYYCTLYSFGIPARHNRDGSTRPEWCELKELPKCEDAVKNQPSAMPKAERRWNPCDWCVYNPPSSMDGKPCTLCPAVANPEPFQKEGEQE